MEQCAALKRVLDEADWDGKTFFQQYVYNRNYASRHPECPRPPMMDDATTWEAACAALEQIPPRGNVVGQKFCYKYALERMGCAVEIDNNES